MKCQKKKLKKSVETVSRNITMQTDRFNTTPTQQSTRNSMEAPPPAPVKARQRRRERVVAQEQAPARRCAKHLDFDVRAQNEALHEAVLRRNVKSALKALEDGADVEAHDAAGRSALALLFEHECAPNIPTARRGRFAFARMAELLAEHASADAVHRYLHVLAERGLNRTLRTVLKSKPLDDPDRVGELCTLADRQHKQHAARLYGYRFTPRNRGPASRRRRSPANRRRARAFTLRQRALRRLHRHSSSSS